MFTVTCNLTNALLKTPLLSLFWVWKAIQNDIRKKKKWFLLHLVTFPLCASRKKTQIFLAEIYNCSTLCLHVVCIARFLKSLFVFFFSNFHFSESINFGMRKKEYEYRVIFSKYGKGTKERVEGLTWKYKMLFKSTWTRFQMKILFLIFMYNIVSQHC